MKKLSCPVTRLLPPTAAAQPTLHQGTMRRVEPIASVVAALALILMTSTAQAITTTWSALAGDWSQAGNWSAGEPTATDDAVIAAGSATVTLDGETCAGLRLGQGGTPGAVQVVTGGLAVQGALEVGLAAPASIGTFLQGGGTVTAQSLDLVKGAFSINNGDFTTSTSVMRLGGSFSLVLSGAFTNTGDLTVEFGSGITVTGGTLTVGTDPADDALVSGAFFYSATPDASFRNLTFDGDTAYFHVQLSGVGLATISVAGTLTLDGVLQIVDTAAPDGRYDIATAGAIVGDFDLVELPAGDWSWGVEDATLFVVKGQETSAVREGWGEIKRAYAR